MSLRPVSILGVPLDLGAGRRGVDMGPSAFRVADIHGKAHELGCDVEDLGDVDVQIQETQDPGNPKLKYLREIKATCETVRDQVASVLGRGRIPVVLGGDHSIAMGTIAGVSKHFAARGEKMGLVWFDAHGDANTPETSPTGNIHGMPCAVALGVGAPELLSISAHTPMVDGSRAAIIGLRDVDVAERTILRETGIGAFTMRDIDERGMQAVMEEAIKRASNGTAGIHVSFDMDAMDPDHAPGVGTPATGGISYREAHLAMEILADTGKVVSCEFVEVNPVLDTRNGTAKLGAELFASLLGKRIL